MEKRLSVELLERYINGDCTAEEVALIKKWYRSSEHAIDYTSTLDAAMQKELEDKIYQHILNNIDVANDQQLLTPEEDIIVTHPARWWRWIGGAAAILAVAIGLSVYQKATPGTSTAANESTGEQVSVFNNSNRIHKTLLPDGSTVWLNPHARLSYPKVFEAAARRVAMSGECFFEVTKNPARPFIISSHAIVTKVWGTSFRVRDNDQDAEADVSVVTGKVSVSVKGSRSEVQPQLNKDEIMLYPHQKAVYSANDHSLKPVPRPDETTLKIWNHEDLLFDNKLMKNIIPALNARYKAHIVVTNPRINHYMLNADFTGFNLPDVLEALNKSLSIDYEIKNNIIELK